MSADSIDKFFAAMVPYFRLVDGDATARKALGPSVSGEARVALYRRLLSRQREVVIEGFYPATKKALAMLDPKIWSAILSEFCLSVEPDSHVPSDYACKFASYVEAAVLDDRRSVCIPLVVAELTDYEWLCVAVTQNTSQTFGEGISWHIREYSRQISNFVRLSLDAECPRVFPESTQETIVVFCSATSLKAQVMPVTSEIMLALASRVGHPLPPGVSPERIAQVDQQLSALGVR